MWSETKTSHTLATSILSPLDKGDSSGTERSSSRQAVSLNTESSKPSRSDLKDMALAISRLGYLLVATRNPFLSHEIAGGPC